MLRPAALIASGDDRPSQDEIRMIQGAMEKHGVPGASIARVFDHQCLWTSGFGIRNVNDQQPVEPTTLFQAASMSKPVTAMALMRLVERGLMDLDAPVQDALRSWRLPPSARYTDEGVTLRRLLNHTAGISVSGFYGYVTGDPLPNLRDVFHGGPPANSAPIEIVRRPGECWDYSGGGYCIVQQALMDVTGKPFEELMDELVLAPCGMKSSSFVQPPHHAKDHTLASGHHADGCVIDGDYRIHPEQAAAGLWTTSSDYARLLLSIDAACTDAAAGVFSKSLITQMLSDPVGDQCLGWLLGVDHLGRTLLHHDGANVGFQCYARISLGGGDGFVVLTNSDRGMNFIADIVPVLTLNYEGKHSAFGLS